MLQTWEFRTVKTQQSCKELTKGMIDSREPTKSRSKWYESIDISNTAPRRHKLKRDITLWDRADEGDGIRG